MNILHEFIEVAKTYNNDPGVYHHHPYVAVMDITTSPKPSITLRQYPTNGFALNLEDNQTFELYQTMECDVFVRYDLKQDWTKLLPRKVVRSDTRKNVIEAVLRFTGFTGARWVLSNSNHLAFPKQPQDTYYVDLEFYENQGDVKHVFKYVKLEDSVNIYSRCFPIMTDKGLFYIKTDVYKPSEFSWKNLTFPEITKTILSLFIPDIQVYYPKGVHFDYLVLTGE